MIQLLFFATVFAKTFDDMVNDVKEMNEKNGHKRLPTLSRHEMEDSELA